MQSPSTWPIVMLAVAFGCLPLPLPDTSAPTLIAKYNGRPIGSPGLRQLELQLKSGADVTRRFHVTQLWRQEGAETRSLVLLETPAELRGTGYLWVEGDATPHGLQVFLRLPAGKRRVLAITPGGFDEGLLGSDFGYSDLLWHIPTSGRHLRETGSSRLDGIDVRVVESEASDSPVGHRTRWRRIRYFVAPDGRALHGADYYDRKISEDPDRTPAKRLRAYDWIDRGGGVLGPSRLVMSTADNHSSELILKAVQIGIPSVEPTLFEPSALGSLADGFERGTPNPVFRRQHK